MKKQKRGILIFLLIGIFLIGTVSALGLLPHRINEDLEFSFSDTIAGDCNVSTLDTPNKTIWINQEMTKTGETFNATITKGNFTNTGIYCVNIECLDGYGNVCREVTKTGFLLGVSEALIYLILSVGILLLSIITFYFMMITPYSNKLDKKGNFIIQVTKLKYIKLGLILITWGLFTWFLNIMIGLAENFAGLKMYYGLFGGIFFIMNALSLPLAVVIIVIMLFEIVRDANIQEKLKKLGKVAR